MDNEGVVRAAAVKNVRKSRCSTINQECSSSSGGFVKRRRLQILEEEEYLKQMKKSLDQERVQLETDQEVFERERERKKERVDQMKKETEAHMKTKVVMKICRVELLNKGQPPFKRLFLLRKWAIQRQGIVILCREVVLS